MFYQYIVSGNLSIILEVHAVPQCNHEMNSCLFMLLELFYFNPITLIWNSVLPLIYTCHVVGGFIEKFEKKLEMKTKQS